MRKSFAIFLCAFAPIIQAGQVNYSNYVTLYDDVAYNANLAEKRSLDIYESITDLRSFNFNDISSSIKIPKGWTVTLYEHFAYQGKAVVLNESSPNLEDRINFDNAVSSIRVERESPNFVYQGYTENSYVILDDEMVNMNLGYFSGDVDDIELECLEFGSLMIASPEMPHLKCGHTNNGDLWLYVSPNPIKTGEGKGTLYNFTSKYSVIK